MGMKIRVLTIFALICTYLTQAVWSQQICTSPACVHTAAHILSSLNPSANPCEDFYEFACGLWSHNYPRWPYANMWEEFAALQVEVNQKVKQMLQKPDSDIDPGPVNAARTMFTSCMDTDTIESLGMQPLIDVLESFGGWPLVKPEWNGKEFQWETAVADAKKRLQLPFLLNIYVSPCIRNSSVRAIYIDRDSIQYPVPVNGKPKFLRYDLEWLYEVAKVVRDYLKVPVSDDSIYADFEEVSSFMDAFVVVYQSSGRVPLMDSYQVMTVDDLQKWTDTQSDINSLSPYAKVQWDLMLNVLFAGTGITLSGSEAVMVYSLEFVDKVIQLINETSPRTIANYLGVRIAMMLTAETTKRMQDLAMEFYENTNAIADAYPRWLHCIDKVYDTPNLGLSFAINHQMLGDSFDESSVSSARHIVNGIRNSFLGLLNEADWMDDTSRSSAVSKAQAMVSQNAYPSWVSEKIRIEEYYSGLKLVEGKHIQNVVALKEFMQNKELSSLHTAPDRNEWTSSPMTVNAFYSSTKNAIVFPAAIMNLPFYVKDTLDAVNYGRIGAVIGHEITHGFDTKGSLYGGDGTLNIWWTANTQEEFSRRTRCFAEQYGNYSVPEMGSNYKVDGNRTLSENIADNGGIRAAYKAFMDSKRRKNLEKQVLPGLQDLTDEQLFFLSYASMWCSSNSALGNLLQFGRDSHTPQRERVRGVLSNQVEFTQAWNCPADSPMNPTEKCTLW